MKFQTLHLLSLVSPLLAHPFSPLDSASEIEKRQSNGAPGGPSTSWVARTKSGNVPYGTPILSCTQKGVIALTFDDGPAQYTEALLDLLDSYGAKATFFINGNNGGGPRRAYDCANGYPELIKRMYRSGHQVASHGYQHLDFSLLTDLTAFQNEIYWNEKTVNNIMGIFPQYIRPPFLSCDALCQNRLGQLGYHIISTDADTKDFENTASPEAMEVSKARFDQFLAGKVVSQSSFNVLAHDIHEQTVYTLTEHMLQRIQQYGYSAVTVGTCMGDPQTGWYRSGTAPCGCNCDPAPTTSPTPTPTPAKPPTPNGNCGNLYGCLNSGFGNCCNRFGKCGSSADDCGTGCRPAYGTCGAPAPTLTVTPNGQCGSGTQWTCLGAPAGTGNCCSEYGWCGSSSAHCGAGCQSGYGTCN